MHRFFQSTGGQESPGEIARFVHVWQLKEGTWRISRVLSYDHKPIEVVTPSIALAPADRQKYEGIYDIALPNGKLSLRVFSEGEDLMVVEEGPGHTKERLRYLGENTFGVSFDPGVRIVIVFDGDHAIKARLLQGGAIMEGPRRP
jgi:hypothetical protein